MDSLTLLHKCSLHCERASPNYILDLVLFDHIFELCDLVTLMSHQYVNFEHIYYG